jgi:tetratricopeptide (TPR) repeat protein
MKRQIQSLTLFAIATGISLSCADALAQGESDHDSWPQAVHSADAIADVNTNSYRALAEYSMHQGQTDKAINLYKKAFEQDPNDPDLHKLYAEALEHRLKSTSPGATHDALISECARHWLIVLRNEVGEEKGTSFHGIGLPGIGTFYEDDDRHLPAKQHLISLVGRTPHAWETDTKYLKNVLKDQYSVAGSIVSKGQPNH